MSSLQFDTMVLHELFMVDGRQFNFLSFTIIFSMDEDYCQVSAQLWFPHPAQWCSCSHWALGKRECPCWTQHSPWGFIDQGITEWPGLKETLKIIPFQPPCCRQGHLSLDSFLRSPLNLALNSSREGTSTTFHVRHYITKCPFSPLYNSTMVSFSHQEGCPEYAGHFWGLITRLDTAWCFLA